MIAACGGGADGTSAAAQAPPSGLAYPSPQVLTVGTPIVPLEPTLSGVATAWTVVPALPAGLALDATNGRISGTPLAATPAATYTITARNAAGSASFALSITVHAALQAALEPGPRTRMGIGQSMNVFFVQRGGGAPYPVYVEPTEVTWSSANPAVLTVTADGVIRARAAGEATITAQYRTYSAELTVQVGGTWLARTLAVPGQGLRRYALYAPAGVTAGDPRPLLLAMHGGSGNAMLHAAMTQIVRLAQEQRLYVAFPEGYGLVQTFNAGACCGAAQAENIDDVAFARGIVTDVLARDSVDPARVYATGFSNGAMLAHRLACAMADRLAGIAAVGGGSGQFDGARTQFFACAPARPIPVLQVHAANDRNYPFAGGIGPDGVSQVNFYGIEATVADWRTHNNVTAAATVAQVSATTRCHRYDRPADVLRPSAVVTLCALDPPDVYDPVSRVVFGGGHSWPGGVRAPGSRSDVPPADFDASTYLWEFFQQR